MVGDTFFEKVDLLMETTFIEDGFKFGAFYLMVVILTGFSVRQLFTSNLFYLKKHFLAQNFQFDVELE